MAAHNGSFHGPTLGIIDARVAFPSFEPSWPVSGPPWVLPVILALMAAGGLIAVFFTVAVGRRVDTLRAAMQRVEAGEGSRALMGETTLAAAGYARRSVGAELLLGVGASRRAAVLSSAGGVPANLPRGGVPRDTGRAANRLPCGVSADAVRLASVLCPDPPRRVPGQRLLGVSLRTAHLLAVGTLLGGHGFDVASERLVPFLVAAIVTGAGMIALELASTCAWLLMGKGLAVVLKLALLLLVLLFGEHRVVILVAVTVVAGFGSHPPARFRHYSVLGPQRPRPLSGSVTAVAPSGAP